MMTGALSEIGYGVVGGFVRALNAVETSLNE